MMGQTKQRAPRRDVADDLDALFPPGDPLLMLDADGAVVGRPTLEIVEAQKALRGFATLSDSMGDQHVPLAMVLDLGRALEQAQGRLTRFQINLLAAMCRGAVKLRGDDKLANVEPIGLSPADEARLLSIFPTRSSSVEDMLCGLMAPPVRLSATKH
jgi:hypothetical protein